MRNVRATGAIRAAANSHHNVPERRFRVTAPFFCVAPAVAFGPHFGR